MGKPASSYRGDGGESLHAGLQLRLKVKWPKLRAYCTQTVTNVATSMVYMINLSGGDFHKVTAHTNQSIAFNGNQSTHEHLTSLSKSRPINF